MVADEVDYVIGVDTHRDEHVLAAVTAPAGAVVAGEAVRADARGYRATLRFATRYADGRRAWAIEGSGTMAPASRVIWRSAARPCSSSAVRRRVSAGYAGRMTHSTRYARRGRRSRAGR